MESFNYKKIDAIKITKLPRMRTYHPHKKHQISKTDKQLLGNIEHRLFADLGRFLVLLEQGPRDMAKNALLRARSDFIKIGPEMIKITERHPQPIQKAVEEFLHSLDILLQDDEKWIDENKLHACYRVTEHLLSLLKV